MLKSPRRVLAVTVLTALAAVACGGGAPEAATTTAAPDRVVQPGDAISVHYVGTLDDGELFDSSRERGQPLSFTVASGRMIPGFDQAVRGMMLGEVKTVRLEPADAYGEWSEENVITVDIAQVPEGTAVGDRLVAGTGQPFIVMAIEGTEVALDGNHRLAGKALTFEIELVSFDD